MFFFRFPETSWSIFSFLNFLWRFLPPNFRLNSTNHKKVLPHPNLGCKSRRIEWEPSGIGNGRNKMSEIPVKNHWKKTKGFIKKMLKEIRVKLQGNKWEIFLTSWWQRS